ncbi:MAG: 3-hydroxyacyl-ACP dehydratase FabZ [Candidatus Omnitrophota bacterium]|jgi:3-hydroxyacyl-[acyl-carrier-protein] dehydratase
MKQLNINEIQKILPQRYPFLLIDKIVEIEPGQRVVAIKNVSNTEGFFPGHFPGKPVMPGALIIEAMAQTAIFIYHSAYKSELERTPTYYLGSIKAGFKKSVVPGDQLKIEARKTKLLTTGGFVNAKAFVGDVEVAEAELVFAVKR